MNSVIDTPVNTTTDDTVITNDVKKKRGRKKKRLHWLQRNLRFIKNVDANQKEASLLTLL